MEKGREGGGGLSLRPFWLCLKTSVLVGLGFFYSIEYLLILGKAILLDPIWSRGGRVVWYRSQIQTGFTRRARSAGQPKHLSQTQLVDGTKCEKELFGIYGVWWYYIHFAIWTHRFCNMDKYILQMWQIQFAIGTNTFWERWGQR